MTIFLRSSEEWFGVYEALSQYVENCQTDETVDDLHTAHPNLAGVEAVLERLNQKLAQLGEGE